MNSKLNSWIEESTRVAAAGLGAAIGGPLGAAIGGWTVDALGPQVSSLIGDYARKFGEKAGQKILEAGGQILLARLEEPSALEDVWREALRLALSDVRALDPLGEYDDWFRNWEICLAHSGSLNLSPVIPADLVPDKLQSAFQSTMERLDAQGRALQAEKISILQPEPRQLPELLISHLAHNLGPMLQGRFRGLIYKEDHTEAWKQHLDESTQSWNHKHDLTLRELVEAIRRLEVVTERSTLASHTQTSIIHPRQAIYFLVAPTQDGVSTSYQSMLESTLLTCPELAQVERLKLSGKLDQYGDTYIQSFERFVNRANVGDWLFTIQPERETWPYSRHDEETIAKELASANKRIVFFESGSDLVQLVEDMREHRKWDDNLQNPFTVIKTNMSVAFNRMILNIIKSKFFGGLNGSPDIVIITIPGPDSYAAQERRELFHKFLTEIHCSHRFSSVDSASRKHTWSWPLICKLLRDAQIVTAASSWLKQWDQREAEDRAKSFLSMCDFQNENHRVLFLCGNDQLALGASAAVKGDRHGKDAIDKRHVAFIGMDGKEEMVEAINANEFLGFTMKPNFSDMREYVLDALKTQNRYSGEIKQVIPMPLRGEA